MINKVESVLHLLGILSDDAVIVDLLVPAVHILMDDVDDELVDNLARFMYYQL
jgi:hypothetical protein